MGRLAACILIFGVITATGCSTPAPTWRSKITSIVDELGRQDAIRLFPQEYRNLLETFEHGEAVFHVHEDDREADNYYQLAFQKAELLRSELRLIKQRQVEEDRHRAIEAAQRAEVERLLREASEAEQRLVEQQRSHAEKTKGKSAAPLSKPVSKETLQQISGSYTVRRGETLPQIAGRPEIYDDSSLWPIIYRANRDQISDPKRLWPGQVLAIPRHFSRDDAIGARRYSGKK